MTANKQLALALECSFFEEGWIKRRHLCVNCPYGYGYKCVNEETGDVNWSCDDLTMVADAIDVIRENEQHMLTAPEIKDACDRDMPMWIEDVGCGIGSGWATAKKVPTTNTELFVYSRAHPDGIFLSLKNYTKTWRCWKEPLHG